MKFTSQNYEWGVKVLKDLVAIPTVNPPGEHYKDFAYYSKEVLEGIGLKVEVVEVPKEYVNKHCNRKLRFFRAGMGRFISCFF